jgi:hypothetical protein
MHTVSLLKSISTFVIKKIEILYNYLYKYFFTNIYLFIFTHFLDRSQEVVS